MRLKLYYIFRLMLFILFIVITFYGLKSIIPSKLSDDTPPTIKEYDLIQAKTIQYTTQLVLIDPSFSDIEIDTIKSAMQEWEYATDGIVKIYTEVGIFPSMKVKLNNPVANFSVIRIKPAKDTDYLIELIDNIIGEPVIVGYTDMMNISKQDILTIYIVNGKIDNLDHYKMIVMHEYFHTLGGNHLLDNSLMAPSIKNSPNYITLTDLKYFCSMYGCDAELLNPGDPAPLCSDTTFHIL